MQPPPCHRLPIKADIEWDTTIDSKSNSDDASCVTEGTSTSALEEDTRNAVRNSTKYDVMVTPEELRDVEEWTLTTNTYKDTDSDAKDSNKSNTKETENGTD